MRLVGREQLTLNFADLTFNFEQWLKSFGSTERSDTPIKYSKSLEKNVEKKMERNFIKEEDFVNLTQNQITLSIDF